MLADDATRDGLPGGNDFKHGQRNPAVIGRITSDDA